MTSKTLTRPFRGLLCDPDAEIRLDFRDNDDGEDAGSAQALRGEFRRISATGI